MAHRADNTVVGQRVAGNALVPCLYAMSFIIGAVAPIAVLFQLGEVLSRKTQRVQIDEIVAIVLLGVGGVAAALLLAGVAAIINYLQNQMQIMNRLGRAQEDVAAAMSRMSMSESQSVPSMPAAPVIPEAPVAQTAWFDSQRLDQIGELLQEINENVLLTPEQREARQRQRIERMHRDLGDVLSRLLADGKFPEAQRRVDEYARSFPDERAAVEQLQTRIEQARSQVEETDYQQAAGRIRDFTGMAAWERAEDVIQELLARHPRSQRVRSLGDDLRQERGKFEQQQRQHLLGEVEQLTGRKERRKAFRLATDLLSRFATSAEAQTIRGKMDTLRDNAEIEIRRDLEEQLKELMRTHRYIEALALAQDIIAKYPNSPQAKVLKEQLPQMMSKAKLQMDQVGGG